jgi:hypothetical protein
MTEPFKVTGTRYFRLPFVPLVLRILPSKIDSAWKTSNWILQRWPLSESYATGVVMKLHKCE